MLLEYIITSLEYLIVLPKVLFCPFPRTILPTPNASYESMHLQYHTTYTDVEEVLLVTKGVCEVECVIGCIHCYSCIVVFSTEPFSVHCQAWPIDCVGITLHNDILHSGSHDTFDGHPMYVPYHYLIMAINFHPFMKMVETSFVYGNLELYIWWSVINK